MNELPHPSTNLDPKIVAALRSDALHAAQNGKFTKAQVSLIHQQKWLKALVPSHYGGQELALPDVLHLEEALAWTDGSIGWMVTLCAGAGWFGGFMDPGLSE